MEDRMSKVHENKDGEKMKPARTLTDRFPNRPETVLIQADLDVALHAKVKAKMEKLKKTKIITWKSLIELALEKWLEEV
jgi:hypothetical protein